MRREWLSPRMRELLTRSSIGVCIRYRWVWVQDGEPVSVLVNNLLKREWLTATYYPGGRAETHPTERGRFRVHLDAAQREQHTLNSALALARAKELAEKEKTA